MAQLVGVDVADARGSGGFLDGFVDAGWLANNNATVNKPQSDSVSSAGLGLRYAQTAYSITADYGRVVNGSTLPSVANSGIPQSGDDKLHVNLSARF